MRSRGERNVAKKYYGQTVTIIADNGKEFCGFVDDYFFPDDNEHGLESIVLKTSTGLYEFTKEEIETIEITHQ